MLLKSIQAKLADLQKVLQANAATGDYSALIDINTQYQQALQSLVALYPEYISRNELVSYLQGYQRQQQSLTALLQEQQTQLQKTLKGTHQLRRYTTC